jgi:dienelactone hydrolase
MKNDIEIIFVCSPFKGNENAEEETREYCRELALAGKLPIAPHLYFTQFLDDDIPEERELGMRLGRMLMNFCNSLNIYVSNGMKEDIDHAKDMKIAISICGKGGKTASQKCK